MYSDQEIAAQAEIFKAMSHPTRLAILYSLKDGEKPAKELYAMVESDASTVSRHLSVLLHAKLVKKRRAGADVLYSVTCDCYFDFTKCINEVVHDYHLMDSISYKSVNL